MKASALEYAFKRFCETAGRPPEEIRLNLIDWDELSIGHPSSPLFGWTWRIVGCPAWRLNTYRGARVVYDMAIERGRIEVS